MVLWQQLALILWLCPCHSPELHPSDPSPSPNQARPCQRQSNRAPPAARFCEVWTGFTDWPPNPSTSGSNRGQTPQFAPGAGPHHQLLQSNRPAYQLLPLLHRGRFLAPYPPVSSSPSLALVLALAQRAARLLLLLPAVTAFSLLIIHFIRLVLPWTLTRPHVSSLPPLFLLFCPPSRPATLALLVLQKISRPGSSLTRMNPPRTQ